MHPGNAQRGLRKTVLVVACALLVAYGGRAQAPAGAPTPAAASSERTSGKPEVATGGNSPSSAASLPPWDVSTIKPAATDAHGSRLMFTPDGISITNVPLYMIAREGFGLEDDRILGGPNWAKTAMFDIEAKVAPEDVAKVKPLSVEQRRLMMVSLLQDRCGLKFHHETRDLPVYDLVLAKGGSKLQTSAPDPADDKGEKHGKHMLMMNGHGHVESTGTDIRGLARVLSGQLHRTVIDKTGLTGNFDYKLDWTPDDASQAMIKSGDPAPGENANSQDNVGPSLFTALEEQLGLKLESAKGPVDVVVIDALEQPTAN